MTEQDKKDRDIAPVAAGAVAGGAAVAGAAVIGAKVRPGRGGSCDLSFQQTQALEEQNRQLRAQVEEMQRRIDAGSAPAPRDDDGILLPGADGVMRRLSPSDIQRAHREHAATMTSAEVDERVARGFDQATRPAGADGRFENYARIMREVDSRDAEAFARMVEAFGITMRREAPADFALLTEKYGKEKLAGLIEGFLKEARVADPGRVAEALARTTSVLSLVEDRAWLRVMADVSTRGFIEVGRDIADFMETMPGAEVPRELLERSLGAYRQALALHRYDRFHVRKVGQALRSQGEQVLGLERIDPEGFRPPTQTAQQINEQIAANEQAILDLRRQAEEGGC